MSSKLTASGKKKKNVAKSPENFLGKVLAERDQEEYAKCEFLYSAVWFFFIPPEFRELGCTKANNSLLSFSIPWKWATWFELIGAKKTQFFRLISPIVQIGEIILSK